MHIMFKRVNIFSMDIPMIYGLYKRAFPRDEQAPFYKLVMNAGKSCVDMLSIYHSDKWSGFMYVVNKKDISCVFYFAINEDSRGSGIGSAAMQAALSMYKGRRLFLVIEPPDRCAPNAVQRFSRRNFYLHNGLKPLGAQVREDGLIYDLLGTGSVTAGEYMSIMEGFFGKNVDAVYLG
ncbi:MAG: GNAT family N-acetyltransferase [Oscillospiraceae bacterium]|nr:GNAT family N-acetyltransferase [Oscillospiraceae bacterium]